MSTLQLDIENTLEWSLAFAAAGGHEGAVVDPTQGRRTGSRPHDDPTHGRRLGSRPGDDPTRAR
jgi:hypothetical protein